MYEYTEALPEKGETVAELANRMGKDGWRVVTAFPGIFGTSTLLFERQAERLKLEDCAFGTVGNLVHELQQFDADEPYFLHIYANTTSLFGDRPRSVLVVGNKLEGAKVELT